MQTVFRGRYAIFVARLSDVKGMDEIEEATLGNTIQDLGWPSG